MITWEKPSGREIVTNDHPANIEHAESLGWKRVECDNADDGAEKVEPEAPTPKRGRPRKKAE